MQLGVEENTARGIAEADEEVDGGLAGIGRGWNPVFGNQSFHFNGGHAKLDTRLAYYLQYLGEAKIACSKKVDDPDLAARLLGTALHPLQDYVAHGSYGLTTGIPMYEVHNAYSPQLSFGDPSGYPDDPALDAVGDPYGIPSSRAIRLASINGATHEYAIYQKGGVRLKTTKDLTENAIKEFISYVEAEGGCKCKQKYLPPAPVIPINTP
jgi:hypothetical protein